MADPVKVTEVVRRLRAEGLSVSIDDFGTGYSSLAHLRHFPVSEIKIDKSFVLGMLDDPADATIVRSAIELAHNLHLVAVAEGVETEGRGMRSPHSVATWPRATTSPGRCPRPT